MEKRFNTTGACFPEMHYMVDITERLAAIKKMIDRGDYFVINRGRQYGKTTTLKALEKYLADDYCVISLDFQNMDPEDFDTTSSFVMAFAQEILSALQEGDPIPSEPKAQLEAVANGKQIRMANLFRVIGEWCRLSPKPIILMIDEIDSASNTQTFLSFLSKLRAAYLERNERPTFKSVILSGVRDIRNLKLKIRDDSEHQHNSPWNIAVDFNVNMSLTVDGIAGMLSDYESDHNTGMDINAVAQLIYDYTSGYPVLVSNICKLLDETIHEWNSDGVISAVNQILTMNMPLFDSLINKLEDYPEMKKSLYQVLVGGQKFSYNPDHEATKLLLLFGFVKVVDNGVVIANRIFETRLYNDMLTSEEMKSTPIAKAGTLDKPEFVKDGILDVELILTKFIAHFHEIYGDKPEKFIEEDGRKCFLIYLRPIINGIGNYYVEAQTRDNRRMDIVIDYLGKRYIIELKIWHGQKYNEDGEKQLSDYLDSYGLKTGYLLTFCFNHSKEAGVKTVQFEDKTLIEATV
ncbi:MAG TPA: AAA-like domain-containing protein [Ruminococcus sp.]|nr:AAA-like domain-containing protein [Ruminococcus sp.]